MVETFSATAGDLLNRTIVDWPVVHAWTEGDSDFVGEVNVTDEVGALHLAHQLVPRRWRPPGERCCCRPAVSAPAFSFK